MAERIYKAGNSMGKTDLNELQAVNRIAKAINALVPEHERHMCQAHYAQAAWDEMKAIAREDMSGAVDVRAIMDYATPPYRSIHDGPIKP